MPGDYLCQAGRLQTVAYLPRFPCHDSFKRFTVFGKSRWIALFPSTMVDENWKTVGGTSLLLDSRYSEPFLLSHEETSSQGVALIRLSGLATGLLIGLNIHDLPSVLRRRPWSNFEGFVHILNSVEILEGFNVYRA